MFANCRLTTQLLAVMRIVLLLLFCGSLVACMGGGGARDGATLNGGGANDDVMMSGEVAYDQATLSTSNLTPSPISPLVQEPVVFSAICTGSQGLSYVWTFGDGSSSAEAQPKHIYTQPGQYDVTFTCSDDSGQQSKTTTQINVMASISPSVSITEGPFDPVSPGTGSLTFRAQVASPVNDRLSYSWDFGDGSPVVGGGNWERHTYANSGLYTVNLAVTDLHGGRTVASMQVGAGLLAFSQTPQGFTTRNNKAIGFSATASEPGQTVSYSWDFGDGSPTVAGQFPSHVYTSNGVYTVTVTASDGRGDSIQATAAVTIVDNQPPSAPLIQAPMYIDINHQPTGFAVITQAAFGDALTYRWDFGDGTSSTQPSPQHSYAKIGRYRAKVTVTDTSGFSASTTTTVMVREVTSSVQAVQCSKTDSHGWCVQNPVPYGASSLKMVDRNLGWAIGSFGTIVKTLDGGLSWSIQVAGGADWFGDIVAIDANTAWAVGAKGTIIKTSNGGASWVKQNSGTSVDLHSIASVGATTAWAVGDGGTILGTQDGGASWTQLGSLTTRALFAVTAWDANTVWAVGMWGVIVKSTDGGVSWMQQTSGTEQNLISVAAVNAGTAWAVGWRGTILKTVDGGANWKAQPSGTTYERLNSIMAVDANTAWVAGSSGTILKTADGGRAWTAHASGTSQSLFSIIAFDTKAIWTMQQNGTLLKSFDGGEVWVAQTGGIAQTLFSITAVDGSVAWAAGENGGLLKTTNGGLTWNPQTSGTRQTLQSIAAANANTAWVVGKNGTILKTTDGGSHWVIQNARTTLDLYSISVVDVNVAWAAGAGGIVLRTTDGGATWVQRTLGDSGRFSSISAVNANVAWATGDSGRIQKTTDGGANWASQIPPTGNEISSVAAVDANMAWAVAAGLFMGDTTGLILNTIESGTKWDYGTDNSGQGPADRLRAVAAIGSDAAWVAGYQSEQSILFFMPTGSVIAKVVKDGVSGTLRSYTHFPTTALWSVAVVNGDIAWAVGSDGFIVHTVTGGQ